VDALEKTAMTTNQTVQIRNLAQIRAQTTMSALRSALRSALTRPQRNAPLLRAQNNAPPRKDLPNALKRAVPIRVGLMRKDLDLRRDLVSQLAMEMNQRKKNRDPSAKRRSPTKRSAERNLLLSAHQKRVQRSQMNAHQIIHAHLRSLKSQRNARRTLSALNSIIMLSLRGN
jgi:hypothetical protein